MDFLCLEFINSSWYINHKLFSDPLRDSAWLMKLADKWNIEELPYPTEEQICRLIDMRSRLATLFEKIIAQNKLTKAELELINSYIADTKFCRQLQNVKGTVKLRTIPESLDWSWFMAEVAASLATLYTSDFAVNLKMCQNPECGWFFVDESKSGNRKWCDDTCASLMKVRRFRQKQKKSEING